MTSQLIELSNPIFQELQFSDSTGTEACLIIHEGEVIEINPKQAWFWSSEWQAGEKQVNQYISRGEIETFDSMEEFLNTL